MPKKKEKKKKDNYYQFDDSRKMKDSVVFKRLFKYAKPYTFILIIVAVLVLVSSFLLTYMSKLFGDVVDLLKVGDTTFKEILIFCFILFGMLVVSEILNGVKGIILARVGQKILFSLRNEIFSHIENLSLREIDKVPVGTFVTRVCNDTNSISDLFTNVMINLISQFATLIYAVILMVLASVNLSLIVFIVVPFLIAGTLAFRKLSRRQFRKITYDNSRVNAFLSENLSGMKITQIFNREEQKMNEFDELSKRLQKSRMGSTYLFSIFRPFVFSLYFTSVILTFYFGSKYVIAGVMTTGALYGFYLMCKNMFNPIQNIAQQYNAIQSAFASAEKIFHIFDMESSIKFIDEPIKADNFKGEIEFKDVWFRYNEEKWIIKGISFHVMPGEVVSFVGPTGAGKTTILSLIERYYDIEKGQILIDGIDIKDYDIHSLRSHIGEMLQDVFLFTGTIKDNITLKDDSLSPEDIVRASKYVNADSFIDILPDKYNEMVKERGNNYSQGQRQLLSFARTIVHNPKMIILDEATSNIDTETEVLIQDSLKKIQSIGTTIMVAHRLSTIQKSDKILFIDDGRVIEEGNHQELLKLKGRYYKLYELQYE